MDRVVEVDLGERTREPTKLICPHNGQEAECALIENTETHRLVGVARCSRFRPTNDVQCDQACVDMLNRGFTLDTDGDG